MGRNWLFSPRYLNTVFSGNFWKESIHDSCELELTQPYLEGEKKNQYRFDKGFFRLTAADDEGARLPVHGETSQHHGAPRLDCQPEMRNEGSKRTLGNVEGREPSKVRTDTTILVRRTRYRAKLGGSLGLSWYILPIRPNLKVRTDTTILVRQTRYRTKLVGSFGLSWYTLPLRPNLGAFFS